MTAVGTPVTRVDGPAKVTGAARYSAEISVPGMAYLAIVGATIASGRVDAIDADAARAGEGVLAVLTHQDLPKIAAAAAPAAVSGRLRGSGRELLPDAGRRRPLRRPAGGAGRRRAVRAGAVRRLAGARLVRDQPSVTTIDQGRDLAYEAERLFGGLMPGRNERGDVDAGLAQADVRVEAAYRMAANHHNPLEAPSTVAVWDGGNLTLYESTQGIRATQQTVAPCSACRSPDVRVITHFVGGGFGAKAMVWPNVTLTAMAARHVGRPGEAHAHPAADVHVQRAPRGAGAGDHARRHAGRTADRDPAREALDHLTVRRLGRARDRRLLAALRLRQLPRRAPAHQGQHDDPDVHPRPGRVASVSSRSKRRWTSSPTAAIDPVELRLRNHTPVDPFGHPWSSDGLSGVPSPGRRTIRLVPA